MNTNRSLLALFTGVITLCAMTCVRAGGIDATLQASIDTKVAELRQWAASETILQAVRAQNSSTPADIREMTQDKWASLRITDPSVRAFTRNAAGKFLKSRQDPTISEAFISDAAGRKVAFLAKTTWFTHKGKPKHDLPMKGQVWQGEIEVDESTGIRQLQVAVPILDGQEAIGSMVIGLDISRIDTGK
jgi:hypothetical protein